MEDCEFLKEKTFLCCVEVVRFKVMLIQSSCLRFLSSLDLFRIGIEEKAILTVFFDKLSVFILRYIPQF